MMINFEPDRGFRLGRGGKSLLLTSMSLGKPEATFTNGQILSIAHQTTAYIDAIEGREKLNRRSCSITPADTPQLSTNVAYKFTDDKGLGFWRRGSIRLTPPATYLKVENPGARDEREGFGTVHLEGSTRSATFTSWSGFNSLILCTSADARKSERRAKAAKFGKRLIRITDVASFAARLAERAGAERFVVRDVTYSNVKVVKGLSSLPEGLASEAFADSLSDDALKYLATNFLEELIQATEAASVFTKPTSYRLERERRFQFVFENDRDTPQTVEDAELAKLIEVIA